MQKFFALLLASISFAALAEEKCSIKFSTKQDRWFPTQYEAQQYCKPYSLLGCKITNPNPGRWNAAIDFSEVFSAVNDDFRDARLDTYRDYFKSIEGRGIYKMPFTFSVKFDCKPSY